MDLTQRFLVFLRDELSATTTSTITHTRGWPVELLMMYDFKRFIKSKSKKDIFMAFPFTKQSNCNNIGICMFDIVCICIANVSLKKKNEKK